jgi:hypothetical protein
VSDIELAQGTSVLVLGGVFVACGVCSEAFATCAAGLGNQLVVCTLIFET